MSKWDIEKLTNIQKMFYGCLKVKEIKIFKNNNKLENINELCYGCQSLLKELDIKGWNLNKIKEKDKENIYGNCYNLKK
jgi:mevalonate kinase